MNELSWLTVGAAARAMRCHRTTAYRRFRALERNLGRPVLVARTRQGREILAVRRGDFQRALGASREDIEESDIAEIKDALLMIGRALNKLCADVAALRRL